MSIHAFSTCRCSRVNIHEHLINCRVSDKQKHIKNYRKNNMLQKSQKKNKREKERKRTREGEKFMYILNKKRECVGRLLVFNIFIKFIIKS